MNNLAIKTPEQFGQTLDSLQKALSDAGGVVWLSELLNMTVLEFLSTIACNNGIRFYYNKSYSLSKPSEESTEKITNGYVHKAALQGNVE